MRTGERRPHAGTYRVAGSRAGTGTASYQGVSTNSSFSVLSPAEVIETDGDRRPRDKVTGTRRICDDPPMQHQAGGGRSIGVRIVAVGKLFQTIFVLGVGTGALLFVDRFSPHTLKSWLETVAPDMERLRHLAEKIATVDDRKLWIIGAISVAYAAVFAVETVGLWLQRTWAEYLTVIITTSYLPYEIYGLTNEVSVAKIITIAINTAVVVYLVIRIVLDRRAKRAAHQFA